MNRPTIRDLANAAGVSVSTVNRVIGGSDKVRRVTMERVKAAAREIGFYGLGSIQDHIASKRPKYCFGILLQQPGRAFYQALGAALGAAAAQSPDSNVQLRLTYLDDLSPDRVAAQMLELGGECDAVAVVAAEHPLVTSAIETLHEQSVPVFALISELSARVVVNYIGLDNWKVGRTAAWAFNHICRQPGKIAILVGNHRYRCQELNESGFRSYFREHPAEFTILDALSTFESSAIAREMTEKLLADHGDLSGLYVAGGGITGVLSALQASERTSEIVTIGHDIIDATRAGLLNGSLTMVLSHPRERLASETIAGMVRAVDLPQDAGGQKMVLPFDIITRENL